MLKKIINDPEDFVDEVVEGLLLAHGDDLVAVSADQRALVRRDAGSGGKVGIVTGGGSGHLPFFLGYVGRGLASGVAVGNVFSSPSPEQIHAATAASDDGAGVLYLYGNYGGDVYNFDIAADLAAAEGIRTTTVLGTDDILSAPPERIETRRGVAGLIFAYKTAGAAADRGDDLDAVAEVARRTVARTRTMGVGLSPTILPAAGQPTFVLADGEMEVGIGIHGEPGHHRGPLEPADAITDRFLTEILAELELGAGSRVAVLVNGLGATPLEELYLIYRRTHQVLTERGVAIHRPYIGEYATSLEMMGASLSILLLDDELAELLDAPAHSPFFTQGSFEPGHREDRRARHEVGAVDRTDVRTAPIRTTDAPGVLRDVLLAVTGRLGRHADELRALDASLGDGDLGITVSAGAKAGRSALQSLPGDAHPSEVLRALGAAFASGNPSTFGALVGGGLVKAARSVDDSTVFSVDEARAVTQALLDHVVQRGHAEVGDKTIVDVLVPVIGVLEDMVDRPAREIADRCASVAEEAVEAGKNLASRRGRAGWVGERSVGHADPGSVAILRFIQDLAAAL